MFLISLSSLNQFNLNQSDKIEYNNLEQEIDGLKTQDDAGEALGWDIYPNLNRRVFTPDTTPGVGDSVIYSFSVDSEADYSLNITAYYDLIDQFNPSYTFDGIYPSAGYLLSNGTWLVVDKSSSESMYYLGIGNDSEDFVWNRIFEIPKEYSVHVNDLDIDVAGNAETGEIRVVFDLAQGEGSPGHVQCYSSDDWGKSWNSDTLANYTSVTQSFTIRGISVAEFNGNFTYMWGLYNGSDYEIWAAQENSTDTNPDTQWTEARRLTALENINSTHPQVFYNTTNNDGSLFVGYNFQNNSDILFNITKLGSGIGGPSSGNWNIKTKQIPLWEDFIYNFTISGGSYVEKPLVYCTKDYDSETFYFIDRTEHVVNGSVFDDSKIIGYQEANWDQDLSKKSTVYFHPEVEGSFDLFAKNGPKCFTNTAKDRYDRLYRGVLNCKAPFTVREWTGETTPLERVVHVFDGKDEEGNSIFAKGFFIDLNVSIDMPPSYLTDYAVIFVDNSPAEVDYSTSDNYISPFASLGTKDEFLINLNSSESGNMKFVLKSEESVISTSNITENINYVRNPTLCGDGLTNYLFYIEAETDSSLSLKVSKSTDGGLSWSKSKSIATTSVNDDWGNINAEIEGDSVFLWTTNNKMNEYVTTNNFLFFSSDGGESFIRYEQTPDTPNRAVKVVSEDLICWDSKWDNDTTGFTINKSIDYGFNWEPYFNLSLPNYDDGISYIYDLKDVCFDPITNNYTFIITNHTSGTEPMGEIPLLALTVSEDGQDYSLVEIPTESISTPYYVSLKNQGIDDNYQKVLFSMNNTGPQYKLVYCQSNDSITFSNWKPYEEMGCDTYMASSFSPHIRKWDFLLPRRGGPSFSKISKEWGFDTEPKQVAVHGKSNFISALVSDIGSELEGEISFKGTTSTGEIIDDGMYNWELIFTDQAEYQIDNSGTLVIDNTAPTLIGDAPITSPEDPNPVYQLNITVPIYEKNPSQATLFYRNNLETEWNNKLMDSISDPSSDITNYTSFIPKNESDDITTIYYYVTVEDSCGNTLSIDNNGVQYSYSRGVFELVKQTGLTSPTLYDDWTWSYVFTSGMDHIDKVWLRKIVDGDVLEDIEISPSGEQNNTYSVSISHELNYSGVIYKFMFRTDTGSDQLIEEIELKRPNIRIEEENEPPSSIDLNEIDSLNVSFIVPEYSEYIDYLYIEYQFDDMPNAIKKNITTSDSGNLSIAASIYRYSFTNFSRNCTKLTYNIVGVDLYGNMVVLNKNRTINIIPELPSWQMTAEQQFITPIVALFVGIVSGVSYTFIASQKSTEERYQNLIEKDLKHKYIEKEEREKQKTDQISDNSKLSPYLSLLSKKYVSLGITAILFSGFYIVGWILVIFLNIAEFALFGFTGAFLSAVFLWVLISDHSVERILRSKEREMTIKDQLILIGISLTIFISLLTIFFIGNTIAWWRVRVNQQSYNISGIIVPRALTTVLTTFFSSIFLLTWSTSKEVSNKADELIEAVEENENPLNIMEKREKAITSIIGNVGKKGVIFIAIIGVTIIFASDLTIYATQGILFIIPFVIGAFITLIIANFLQKKQITDVKKIVLDNLTICPYCKEKTSLGGTYCEHCGKKLVHGKRFNDGITCQNCNKLNAIGTKHCKYCGEKLQDKDNIEETTIQKRDKKSPIKDRNQREESRKES